MLSQRPLHGARSLQALRKLGGAPLAARRACVLVHHAPVKPLCLAGSLNFPSGSSASRLPGVKWAVLPGPFRGLSLRHDHSHSHSHGHSHSLANDPSKDSAAAQNITVAGVVINIGLSVSKAVIGYVSNSASMLADAVHSLSDLISDGTTLLAVRFSRQPATAKFAYGFGKLETLGSLFISTMLISAGGGMGMHSLYLILDAPLISAALPMVDAAAMGKASGPLYWALAAAGLSVILKEVLYHATIKIANRIGSPALVANAWHHRSDAWSSIVALVGIGGNLMGYPLLDPSCGLIVSGMIVWMGVGIGWDSMLDLMDVSPSMTPIATAVSNAIPEQHQFYDLKARRMGPMTEIDFKVLVQPSMDVIQANQLVEAIRREVLTAYPGVVGIEVVPDTGAVAAADVLAGCKQRAPHDHGSAPKGAVAKQATAQLMSSMDSCGKP